MGFFAIRFSKQLRQNNKSPNQWLKDDWAKNHARWSGRIFVISFLNRADPFSRVCLFHFYDICNRNQLALACCYDQVSGF